MRQTLPLTRGESPPSPMVGFFLCSGAKILVAIGATITCPTLPFRDMSCSPCDRAAIEAWQRRLMIDNISAEASPFVRAASSRQPKSCVGGDCCRDSGRHCGSNCGGHCCSYYYWSQQNTDHQIGFASIGSVCQSSSSGKTCFCTPMEVATIPDWMRYTALISWTKRWITNGKHRA